MADIDLSAITLRLPSHTGGTTTTTTPLARVAFDPPLRHWDERRARLVDMTRVARQALGVPDPDPDPDLDLDSSSQSGETVVTVDEYMPPRPGDWLILLSVVFYFALFALFRTGWFAQHGSGAAAAARAMVEMCRFPYGVEGLRWVTEVIFVPVVGIHAAEAWWLERTRLRKFGVMRGSRVWWFWMVSVFVEGMMAFKRFDIVVERLRAEKGKKGK
ncbi:hypothetical protein VTK56DRAFT_9894 [Thermocarpiscus australiensis]